VANPFHAGTSTRPDAPRFARRANALLSGDLKWRVYANAKQLTL